MATASKGGQGLTCLGKILVLVVILVLLGGAGFLMRGKLFPQGGKAGLVDLKQFRKAEPSPEVGEKVEAPDTKGITTVQEYTYVPREKLPPVKGTSDYKWDPQKKVVKFPINVWIGWLPIVAANHGAKPNDQSVFAKKGFKVELTLIDDPAAARDAYAVGESHVLWGTLDMMVLFAPELMKDSRTAPRVCQQVDWSNGGDGIVVRDYIKSVADLKGKTIVYAQNSPSEYFINSLLLTSGIQPVEVSSKYTQTAFEAATAFVADKSIDGMVSWAPDIYKVPEKVSGAKVLTTTADASKLIADVWAVRADFARDHPDVVKGLVEGIFEGMEWLEKSPANKDQACKWLADFYGFGVDEIKDMLADAHSTNFAENKQFFLNQNNPANFQRTWESATAVYKALRRVDGSVRFDQVMDFTYIQQVEQAGRFKGQQDTYTATFSPDQFGKVAAEAPIVTKTIRIHFFPNSADLWESARDEFGNKIQGKLYDPTVNDTLEAVAKLAGQFDRAIIAIVGHTDASMKGRVPDTAVKDLSLRRAKAVKDALVKKFKFDPNKFSVQGKGWDQPLDPANHALNRRVEIGVYQPEAG